MTVWELDNKRGVVEWLKGIESEDSRMLQVYKRWSKDEFQASEAAEVNVEVHIGETNVVYFVVRSKAFNKPLYKLKVDAEDLLAVGIVMDLSHPFIQSLVSPK